MWKNKGLVMNILLVASDNNKTSGAFLCLVELALNLEKLYNHRVVVVVPKNGDGVELLKLHQIPYYCVYSFSWVTYNGYGLKALAKTTFKKIAQIYNRLAIRKISEIIVEENIDIVHINTIFSYVGALAAILMHKKLVWHIRESLNYGFSSHIINEKNGYKLINRSNKVIAVSNAIKDEYSKYIDKKNFTVVYDGVDSKFYNPSHEILQSNDVVFACVGALVQDKNQIELLKSLKYIIDQGITNFKLLIVGDGILKDELNSYVKINNLSKNIKFLGRRSDVNDILSSVDCLFSVSKAEAFGRTIIEAMLSGSLVVAAQSPNSAANEIIEPGLSGLLYNLGDIKQLSKIILEICQHKSDSELKRLAIEGQKKAISKYSDINTAKKINDIYFKIMEN